ncbi:MAG: hypothetical protein U9R10_03880 [Euryarchaeota archaeon]|nr:hypothetical protein [Euryarchaeota archaeon]
MWFRLLRQFAASTEAQAFAIGAVILITIAVTGLTVYLSINAPIATKECEFQHSTEVAEDFAVFNCTVNWMHTVINSCILEDLDGKSEVSERRTAISSFVQGESLIESVPIKLTPTRDSAIALPLASGTISFLPDKGGITVRVIEPNEGTGSSKKTGIDNFNVSPSDKWNITCVVTETGWNGDVNVTAGNVTLDGPPYVSAIIVSNMADITGGTGFDTGNRTVYYNATWHGNISWYVTNITAETFVTLKVRTNMSPDMTNATKWNNCYGIESEDGFNSFPLSDLYTVSNGHRYVQFRAELNTENPQKRPELINVSLNYDHSPENVTLADASGIIQYKSSYHYYPNQNITYGNGAVLKSQDDGELVYGNFSVTFRNVSTNKTRINLTLVNLTGTKIPAVSGGSTLIRLRLLNRELVSDAFYYHNLTLTVNTNCTQACGDWFNKTLEKLTTPYVVTVNTTSETVELFFYANDPDDGIELYLEKATIGVVM